MYFQDLNYVFGNEDSTLEYGMLEDRVQHVFAVAGSGTRVIPLIAKRPCILTCNDISAPQLAITRMRIESVRSLEYPDYLAFWGYGKDVFLADKRKKMFECLHLPDNDRKYLEYLYRQNHWNTLLYAGKWEKAFRRLSCLLRIVVGRKGLQAFSFTDADRQSYFSYIDSQFPHRRWSSAVLFLGNAAVFNALLYKGTFPKKNIPDSLFRHYESAFMKIFAQGPIRYNFLMQLLFFGELRFIEGLPIECDYHVFTRAKAHLPHLHLRYQNSEVVHTLHAEKIPVDFLSLSDVPSYFTQPVESTYLQEIAKGLAPGAKIVVRHYLRIPENASLKGYADITERYQQEIAAERTQMYHILILQKGA